jgi:membrane protein implicated in regulation of membrane protease activity
MNLDLRLPIGLMFTIIGALLTAFGLMSDDAIYARSLGINVNLWWGLVLLAFGLVMLALVIRAVRQRHESRETASQPTSS